MNRLGHQGLTRAGLAHQQGGSLDGGHFFDQLLGFLDCRTPAHDDQVTGFLGELHPQGQVFVAQVFFPGPAHLEVEADELHDESGYNAEEADIFFKGDLLAVEAVHAQDADGRAVHDNRYSDEGDLAFVDFAGFGFIQEEGFLADIGNHEGLSGAKDQAGDPFVQAVERAAFLQGSGHERRRYASARFPDLSE